MLKTSSNNEIDKTPQLRNDNIIVWLDFDAYAYINFGIISALSKLGKFNFIGIVTTPEDLIFFQNQSIISFTKILFYPNCYAGKSDFNIDNLKKFEEKYELNLWLDVFAERSFYKYWIDFHKFSKNEIFSIIENSISFFVDALERYKPRLVLMQQAGENISNLLFYRIAKKMGIEVLMPSLVHLHNRILISNNLLCTEISNDFKKLIQNYNDISPLYDEEFIKKQNTGMLDTVFNYNFKPKYLQKINHFFKRLFHKPESIYKNMGKTYLKLIKYRYQTFFKIKKRKQFLDNNSIRSLNNEKFLYLPLASEPEARILVTSPFYSNQVALVENVAKALPINLVLYVKEHPVQRIKSWRPIDDYKKIISIPNVKLVHPSVNNQQLISKSEGVIAISGGTGFEALFSKKPVLLFADDFYDVVSMVTKIKKFVTLPFDIKNALSNFKFSNKELNALMQSFNDNCIAVPYYSLMKDGNVLSSIQRYEQSANLTMKAFHNFYETYRNYFELIANKIFSRL